MTDITGRPGDETKDVQTPALAELERAARLIAWGSAALGVVRGLRIVADAFVEGWGAIIPWPLALLDGLFVAGTWALGGFSAGALLRGLGRVLLLRQAQRPTSRSGAAPQVEAPAPLLEAASLAAPGIGALLELREQALADVRRAIRTGDWDEAREKLNALAADHVEDARIRRLELEFQSAREAARDEHLSALHAARAVNDPDRVLELHRLLVPLLEEGARSAVEAELAAWFLRLIHNRLRTGRIQPELAELAGRIAEEFGHTVDGASLRASLPTLRRSAGLCPRCAGPYAGVADACPACLARASGRAAPPGDGATANTTG
jgi:hypothetical protein